MGFGRETSPDVATEDVTQIISASPVANARPRVFINGPHTRPEETKTEGA